MVDVKKEGVVSPPEMAQSLLVEKPTGESTEQEEQSAIEKLRKSLIEVFDRDDRVKFVIAMGSSAEGKENRLSDIDICVVLNDDAELNQMLKELDTLFPQFGKLVGYYSYNPYHYYAVFEPQTPLDIYFISSSLYFTVRSEKNKTIVDHSNRGNAEKRELSTTEPPDAPKDESNKEAQESIEETVRDLFLKGFIRTFRLLSKIEKGDYPTLAYILNRIREEQIVPLLTYIDGYSIPHSKAIKLQAFDEQVRELFVDTYCKPELESCMQAVSASAEILKILFEKASQRYQLEDMQSYVDQTYEQVKDYRPGTV